MIEIILSLIPFIIGLGGAVYGFWHKAQSKAAKQEAKESEYRAEQEHLHRKTAEKILHIVAKDNQKEIDNAVTKAGKSRSHFSD